MSVSKNFDKITYKANLALRYHLVRLNEFRNINKKKSLWNKVVLTASQKQEIDEFFRKYYGKKYSYKWHRLYQSYTGEFHKDYFPEILFSSKLEPRLNNYHEANLLGDKNLLGVIFGKEDYVYIPKSYASCVRGLYRNCNERAVSYENITKDLNNIGECIIKKTVDTSSGRDVQICAFENGRDKRTGESVDEILSRFGNNWVVSELIHQDDRLANINSSSVNTFRIITYICGGELATCPVAFRMGRNGSDRDNIHYGGITIGVNSDGTLRAEAYSEYGEKFTKHPDSGIVFENYKILHGDLQELTDVAVRLHSLIPQLKIISWDFTINNNGKPVVIEMNTIGQSAWFCQMVNGETLFGENTGKMLQLIK